MSTRYVAEEGAAARAPAHRRRAVRSLFDGLWAKRKLRPSLAVALLPDVLALLLIGATVTFVVARMPIDGRGDYGQWLMTSRYYLGQDVPDYRTITALPPLVPFLLAGTRLIIPDPGIALQTFNVVLLLALVASVYFVAAAVFADRVAGLFAVALAFLVTDRFLELFAFGGLLQAAAMAFTLVSVAGFMQAGRYPDASRGWWTLGSLSLALAALSHVGTGLLAVPVCFSVALVSALRTRRNATMREYVAGAGDSVRVQERQAQRRSVLKAALGAMVIPLAVLAYWLIVLLPASVEYVTNPASLNYRGPDRLLKGLLSYWPTISVIAVGLGCLGIGAARELLHRRMGPYVVLCLWTAAAWASLLLSILSQASTDYPRFATPLLAPLIVAGSGGLLSLSRWLPGFLSARAPVTRRVDWRLGVVAVVCLLAPLGFMKYAAHVRFYQPLDAAGLTSVGAWLDDELTDGQTVVSPVREGKWIEGVTGQAAVFSQPVRYTFRAIERQRSLVADAIVRSTMAVASHDFFLKFSHGASNGEETIPRGLIVGAKHRGEFLDLLRIPSNEVRILSTTGPDETRATLIDLQPAGIDQSVTEHEAAISTHWTGDDDEGAIELSETTLLHGDSRFELIEEAAAEGPMGGVELQLWPLRRTATTRIDSTGQQADLFFPQAGLEEPHLRINVVGGNGVFSLGRDGILTVRSDTDRVHLEVTALTAGHGTERVQILDPVQLVDSYDVAAIVLVRYEPAFETRVLRMEALGFRVALEAGAYVLMMRD